MSRLRAFTKQEMPHLRHNSVSVAKTCKHYHRSLFHLRRFGLPTKRVWISAGASIYRHHGHREINLKSGWELRRKGS